MRAGTTVCLPPGALERVCSAAGTSHLPGSALSLVFRPRNMFPCVFLHHCPQNDDSRSIRQSSSGCGLARPSVCLLDGLPSSHASLHLNSASPTVNSAPPAETCSSFSHPSQREGLPPKPSSTPRSQEGLLVRKEDPLEEGMATHSSILAWRIPWTEEPGGLQFRKS